MASKVNQYAVNRYAALSALLIGSAHIKYKREIFNRWAADCGISAQILRRRIADPETIALGELRQMASAVDVDPSRIIEVLPL